MEDMKFTEERLSVMRVEGYLNRLEDRRDFTLLREMNGESCAAKQYRKLLGLEMEMRSFASRQSRIKSLTKSRRRKLIKQQQSRRAESAQKGLD
jgi:hypothetical protein